MITEYPTCPDSFSVSEDTTVTAAGGLTVTHRIMRVVSSGGDVNVTADPQISVGDIDGQPLIVQGTSDTNRVIFEDGTGLEMSASVTLGNNATLEFFWDSGETLWIMRTSDTK